MVCGVDVSVRVLPFGPPTLARVLQGVCLCVRFACTPPVLAAVLGAWDLVRVLGAGLHQQIELGEALDTTVQAIGTYWGWKSLWGQIVNKTVPSARPLSKKKCFSNALGYTLVLLEVL